MTVTTNKVGSVYITTGQDPFSQTTPDIVALNHSTILAYGDSSTIVQGSNMTFIGVGHNNAVTFTAGSGHNTVVFDGAFGSVLAHGKDDIYFAKNTSGTALYMDKGSSVHIDIGKEDLTFAVSSTDVQYFFHGVPQAALNAAYAAIHITGRANASWWNMDIGDTHIRFGISDTKPDLSHIHAI